MEIAGQHEHAHLGRAGYQRGLLDSFIGPAATDLVDEVRDAVRSAGAARRKLEELEASERSRSRELDVLSYEIAEIEKASLAEGEVADLQARASRLEHASTIAVGVATAAESLTGEGGADEALATAESAVRQAAAGDPGLTPLADRLEAARYEVADVATELTGVDTAPDSDALEGVHARLGVIARLRRKYGPEESDVMGYLASARTRAEELGRAGQDIEHLRGEHERLLRRASEAAERLTSMRREAAPGLAAAVEARLHDLALPGARFEVGLEPKDLYEGGLEDVELLVAPNKGEAALPVARSASGGELSRISLALHLVTTTGLVGTMIFDEVDAGVGGEAARAVGAALAQLAESAGVQVLVVTHLPQVAAFASAQYRVRKEEADGRTVAVVERVEGDERVSELSRMLAGLPGSDVAREHARELLELAATGTGS